LVSEQGVGDGHDGHALMMRHEGAHDRHGLVFRQPDRRIVQRLVEAVAAARAGRGQALEVARRGLRIDHGGKRRRVGRDDDVLPQAALETEARHAEIGILVGEFAVADVVGGFRDAPRHAERRPVVDLALHDQPAGLLDEASGRRPDDQRGHQILEHRSRPRDQRGAVRDRRDGAAETEPMAGRDIALGDRHEARQPRFGREQVVTVGIERILRHPVADREQPAVAVEQKAELHGERADARADFQRGEPRRQRGRVRSRDVEVVAVALDRGAGRLGPEQHVGAGIVTALDRERAGDVGHGLGAGRQRGEALCNIRNRLACRIGGEPGERILELAPGHRRHAALVAQQARLLARERDGVCDAGEASCVRDRMIPPFPAGIRQRDEVPGQIAAVDRGYVAGIERPQIPRVVPIEQVPAEALELAHGRERRLQASDRRDGPAPAEIAGAHRRQQIKADIGGRGPMRQHRGRVLLEIVRRQHVVRRGHESLEEAPGAPRRQPQDAGVAVGHRQAARPRRRAAGPARDRRRGEPQRRERQRQRPGCGSGDDHRQNRDHDRAGHLAIESQKVEPRTGLRLRGRDPFQEMPAGHQQPDQGAHDRVAHQAGLVGERDDEEGRLGKRELQIGAERCEVAARRDAEPLRNDGGGGRNERRQHDGGDHEGGPDRGRGKR
jgi:hypothetical protein